MSEIKELKQLSKEELKEKMKNAREKLRQMRFDLQAGKVKDVREIRQTKKDIARMMTLLSLKFKARNSKQTQDSNN